MIKKAIRAILKVPITPFFVLVVGLILLTSWCMIFVSWLYEWSEYEKRLNKELKDEYTRMFVKWFTTI